MKRLAWLTLTSFLVLALAGTAIASARVLFSGAVGRAQVRPVALSLSADGTLEVNQVAWSAWGGSRAFGTGTAEYHGCSPSCGAAKAHYAAVSITLSKVIFCRGKQYYTHVALVQRSGALLDKRFLRLSWSPCGP